MAIECKTAIVSEQHWTFDLMGVLPIAIAGMFIGAIVVDATTTKTFIKL